MKKSRQRSNHSHKPPRVHTHQKTVSHGKRGRVPSRYPSKLPPHVKKFTIKVKGKKITAYWSKITNRRISAKVIRQRRADQAIAERFPGASKKGIRNIKNTVSSYSKNFKDMGRAEKKIFEDRYKSLFEYLRRNAPNLLPDYQDLMDASDELEADDELEDMEDEEDE